MTIEIDGQTTNPFLRLRVETVSSIAAVCECLPRYSDPMPSQASSNGLRPHEKRQRSRSVPDFLKVFWVNLGSLGGVRFLMFWGVGCVGVWNSLFAWWVTHGRSKHQDLTVIVNFCLLQVANEPPKKIKTATRGQRAAVHSRSPFRCKLFPIYFRCLLSCIFS